MAKLYVIATPIGNIGDITERAKQTLNEVDFIVAEDTRNSGILLNRLGIKKQLISYHKFNEKERSATIIEKILSGKTCAIVTDAGTPCISDPGSVLVRECAQNGIEIIGIPGASAVVLALSVCGFDVDNFAFYGFFPRTKGEIKEFLEKFESDSIKIGVFYESPKRIEDTLSVISSVLPNSKLCLCNDLTKKFEKIYRGDVDEIIEMLKNNDKSELGEYALVIENQKETKQAEQSCAVSVEARIFDKVYSGMDVKSAVKQLQQEGVPRNDAYQAGLHVREMLK